MRIKVTWVAIRRSRGSVAVVATCEAGTEAATLVSGCDLARKDVPGYLQAVRKAKRQALLAFGLPETLVNTIPAKDLNELRSIVFEGRPKK